MSEVITVPDIGDFESVEIIEVLVKEGDAINKDDPIVTLESDKSSVEVPSPYAGIISKLNVKVGDKVSKGSPLVSLENGSGTSKNIIKVLLKDSPTGASRVKKNTRRFLLRKKIMNRTFIPSSIIYY